MCKKIIAMAFLLGALRVHAQQKDTLELMFYNLLNFPAGTSGIANRQDSLKKIVQYVDPDVLMVCELSNSAGATTILNTLNSIGTKPWQAATFITNTSSGDALHQMLFYNNAKLGLAAQSVLPTNLRDINRYVLYYRDPNLPTHQDSATLDLYVCHLKASTGVTNETQRNQMITVARNHFSTYPVQRNFFLAGDFNLYTSNEPAWQTITTTGLYPLQDPVNRVGAWNNNSAFVDVHTQCTRLTALADGASGGLDDRFDFILTSSNVISGARKVRYLPGTYKAVGQDGLHFNNAVNAPPANTSVPAGLATTLFYTSDHLPLRMQVEVTLPNLLPEVMGSLQATQQGHTAQFHLPADLSLGHRYTLEHSPDGIHYHALSLSPQPSAEGLTWPPHTLPQGGSYFRARADLQQGGALYSNTLHLSPQAPHSLLAHAWQEGDRIAIEIQAAEATPAWLRLTDASGRLLRHQILRLQSQDPTRIHFEQLPTGLYLIEAGAGNHVIRTKIILQR